MKFYRYSFLLFILLMFLLTGCQMQKIKIGFVGGLTGTNSELGISGLYGATLAVEEINGDGGINGKKIELIIKDDKNNKQTALEVDKQLVEEKCVGIIGHYVSSVSDTVMPLINSSKTIMISPTITTDTLNDKDDNLIKMSPSVIGQAKELYKLFIAENRKNILVAYDFDNDLYAGNLFRDLVEINADNVLTIHSIAFSDNDPINSDKNLDIVRKLNPDGILIIAAADETAQFCQLLRKNNLKNNIYFSTWAMTNDLIEHGGKTVEGAKGVNFVDFSSKNESYLRFVGEYTDRFGIKPDFSAMYSYEAVKMLAAAMKNSKSTSPLRIKNEILSKSKFQGLQNSYVINQYGDCDRKLYICRVEDMNFVTEN